MTNINKFEILPAKPVLPENLYNELWPALQPFGGVVRVHRVAPMGNSSPSSAVVRGRRVHLRLPLPQPGEQPPGPARLNAPLAEESPGDALAEVAGAQHAADQVHLAHDWGILPLLDGLY